MYFDIILDHLERPRHERMFCDEAMGLFLNDPHIRDEMIREQYPQWDELSIYDQNKLAMQFDRDLLSQFEVDFPNRSEHLEKFFDKSDSLHAWYVDQITRQTEGTYDLREVEPDNILHFIWIVEHQPDQQRFSRSFLQMYFQHLKSRIRGLLGDTRTDIIANTIDKMGVLKGDQERFHQSMKEERKQASNGNSKKAAERLAKTKGVKGRALAVYDT